MMCTCPVVSGGVVLHRVQCPQADVPSLRRALETAEAKLAATEGERARTERARDLAIEELGRANVRGNGLQDRLEAAEAKLAEAELEREQDVECAAPTCSATYGPTDDDATVYRCDRQAPHRYLHSCGPKDDEVAWWCSCEECSTPVRSRFFYSFQSCPECVRLRRALNDLLDNVGGHNHWDSTMRYGAGCDLCLRQNAAKERARAALAAGKEIT